MGIDLRIVDQLARLTKFPEEQQKELNERAKDPSFGYNRPLGTPKVSGSHPTMEVKMSPSVGVRAEININGLILNSGDPIGRVYISDGKSAMSMRLLRMAYGMQLQRFPLFAKSRRRLLDPAI